MGKSRKKKGKGGSGGGGDDKQKLGRRKQLQLEKRQREENELKADEAIAAGLNKLSDLGNTGNSDLFVPIPPKDDCPICLVPLPFDDTETTYMDCCGKFICCACSDASWEALSQVNAGRDTKKQPPLPFPSFPCAFCRAEAFTSEDEYLARMMESVESNDAEAMTILSGCYRDGSIVEKDAQRAFDLLLRAVELGNYRAFSKLGIRYFDGEIIQRDLNKYRVCMEALARAGSYTAHYNLGSDEFENGNDALAVKHYHVAAGAGHKLALDRIQNMHQQKRASHSNFLCAIRAYQAATEEQSSDERTRWAEKKKAKESGNMTM